MSNISVPGRAAPFCARALNLIFYLILFASLSGFIAPAAAQDKPAPDDDDVLRVSTDLLLFPARIRDKNGKRPAGLTEQDLSLKDPDGVVSSLYFSAGVDRVAIVFSLDQSGSVREVIGRQRSAAVGLYQRFGTLSQIAVLRFSDRSNIAAPFTRETTAAVNAFDFGVERNRPTAIFDAAAKAVDMFRTLPKVRSERRIVVLISDGLDNFSATKPDSVIKIARADRVSFYVIHLPLFEPEHDRLVVRRPTNGFRALAEKTGGKYFLARDSPFTTSTAVDLRPIFDAIEQDLKSQYLIGFYLNEKANDGRSHKFSLSVPKGLEYQIVPHDYSRTQPFFVNRPREFLKTRE